MGVCVVCRDGVSIVRNYRNYINYIKNYIVFYR